MNFNSKKIQSIFFISIFILLFLTELRAQSIPQDSLKIVLSDSTRPDTISTPSESQKSDLDTTLFYDAKTIDTHVTERMTYLIGDAVVKYKKMTLNAAKITVDFDKYLLIAEGSPDTNYAFNEDSTEKEMQVKVVGTPIFSDGGDKISGTKMIYNYRSEKGRVIKGRTEYEGGHYCGSHIKKVGENVLNVSGGIYTTCDKSDAPHFHFRSRRMKIITKSMVVAKPIVMYIGNIPVAVLPFAFFPNKSGRHSGIIIPRYGQSLQEGRYIQGLGYYWVTNDYTDVQARLNYYDRSGVMLDGRFRYAMRYKLSGSIEGSITNKEFITGRKIKRWDLRLSHNHIIDPSMRIAASGNFISDDSYYKNYSSNLSQRLTRQLRSNITFSKSWPNAKNSITVNLSHVRDLESGEQTLSLPQMSFRLGQRQLFKFKKDTRRSRTRQKRRNEQDEREPSWYHSIYYSYNSRLVNSIRTGGTDFAGKVKSKKVDRRIDHNASINMSSPKKFFGWLGWNQSISYQEKWFDRYLSYHSDDATKKILADTIKGFAAQRIFSYSTSANTKIYGLFTPNIGRIKAIRHVVTPSISFSYQPDFTESMWGYFQEIADSNGVIQKKNRFFYATPTTARKSISFSVHNLFQMKTQGDEEDAKEKKFDLFTVNFNSGYNFEAKQFKLSNLSTSMRANPSRNFSINFNTTHSFYKFDSALSRQVNKYLWNEKKFPRLTNLNLSLTLRLQGKRVSEPQSGRTQTSWDEPTTPFGAAQQTGTEIPGDELGEYYEEEVDRFQADEGFRGLDISWSTSLSFNFTLSKYNPQRPTKRYYLRVSGMKVKLTKNWDITYQAQIDLLKKQIVQHSFNFRRDLHCWEMTFRWVPSGLGKQFYLRINVKATQLRDIKVEKRGGRASILRY